MAATVDFEHVVRQLRSAGCVFAEREALALFTAFADPHDRKRAVEQRSSGVPLEYVVGVAAFAGVEVAIGPPAFIPRHRAEALVVAAADLAPAMADSGRRRALDLGCGSGAIAAALTSRLPGWDVHATDIDARALVHARTNAATFGFTVHQGDWWSGLPMSLRGGFDLVVAHLPYIPTSEVTMIPRDFRDAEPLRTVDGGADGLDPWRQVACVAAGWLTETGAVLTQVTHQQRDEAVAVGQISGLQTQATAGEDGVVIVGRPSHP